MLTLVLAISLWIVAPVLYPPQEIQMIPCIPYGKDYADYCVAPCGCAWIVPEFSGYSEVDCPHGHWVFDPWFDEWVLPEGMQ